MKKWSEVFAFLEEEFSIVDVDVYARDNTIYILIDEDNLESLREDMPYSWAKLQEFGFFIDEVGRLAYV